MDEFQRESRDSMCGSKVAYKSKAQVMRVLSRLRKRRQGITKEHRPYKCPICHGWHIGRGKH